MKTIQEVCSKIEQCYNCKVNIVDNTMQVELDSVIINQLTQRGYYQLLNYISKLKVETLSYKLDYVYTYLGKSATENSIHLIVSVKENPDFDVVCWGLTDVIIGIDTYVEQLRSKAGCFKKEFRGGSGAAACDTQK